VCRHGLAEPPERSIDPGDAWFQAVPLKLEAVPVESHMPESTVRCQERLQVVVKQHRERTIGWLTETIEELYVPRLAGREGNHVKAAQVFEDVLDSVVELRQECSGRSPIPDARSCSATSARRDATSSTVACIARSSLNRSSRSSQSVTAELSHAPRRAW